MKKPSFARRAAQAAVFLLAALLGLYLLNLAIVDDVHSYTRLMLKEMYEQDENIDVLFLGSSHCYRAYDPQLATELLGENCFNGGSSQQILDGAYRMLQETAKTNRIRTVYLECFYTIFQFKSSSELPEAAYVLTDYMKNSPEKFRYLYEVGGLGAIYDNFLPARHNTISPSEILDTWKAKLNGASTTGAYTYVTYPEEEYRGNGFVYVNTQVGPDMQFGQICAVDPEQPITPFAEEYLQKIVDFCAQEDIRLVLTSAPLPTQLLQNTPSYQYFVDYMTDFAARNGTVYWDFGLAAPDSGLELSYESFSDAHHLSGEGAERFTEAFCKVVQADRAQEDTSRFFYDTAEEKISLWPDGTLKA